MVLDSIQYQFKIYYTQMEIDPNYMNQLTESQVRLMNQLEIIIIS